MSPTVVLTGCVFKVLRRDDWQNVTNPGFSKSLTLYPSYMSCTYVHMPLCACTEEPESNLKCYSSGAVHLVLWSFSLGLEIQWGWLARRHRGSVCLSLISSTEGLQSQITMTRFSHWGWARTQVLVLTQAHEWQSWLHRPHSWYFLRWCGLKTHALLRFQIFMQPWYWLVSLTSGLWSWFVQVCIVVLFT